MKEEHVPKILLIGAGNFGVKYIKILKRLEENNLIHFTGVIVKTDDSIKKISKEYNIPVWNNIDNNLIKQMDAVIIVTPPETHYDLVKQCLNYTNVFVEKPLTEKYELAKELNDYSTKNSKILMVGHVFRFHPLVKKLKEIFSSYKEKPYLIKGKFVNPISTDNHRNVSFEMLHLYDIIDYLFNKMPTLSVAHIKGRLEKISLRYPNKMDAVIEIGWGGDERKRNLNFSFSDNKFINCDLANNIIEIFNKGKKTEEIKCESEFEPLEEELRTFLKVLNKETKNYPNGEIGTNIVKIASSINVISKNKKPKIAIIGAGIFGTNCAIKLGENYDVTIFERNNDILKEASLVNQYRHHLGHHYPRSVETVNDIKEASKSFESLYKKALIYDFPTYYCVAKEGSRVPADQYIKFCKENGLPFVLEYPDKNHVNHDMISASLKTLEPIYNYPMLYNLVNSYLSDNKNIKMKLKSEVINGYFDEEGKKVLVIKENDKKYEEKFDFVINVTYANINKFAYWFNFPIKPLRIDLVEALMVKLPIPKISFAIMDGPFTNMVPTAEDDIFTLVHIKHSMIHRGNPKNGLIPKSWEKSYKLKKSNIKKILDESKKFIPILEKADVVESRHVFRGVNAYREHDDARPSDIIDYGFGCYSILGGKIINCVCTAQKIFDEIKQ